MKNEKFGSRLGFILISAGCAIGLGNVWRFPYITGQYGGAAFVLIYLVFLAILGLPIMVMEFAVGRGSQHSIANAFETLEPSGTKWHWYKWFGIAGNYLLMMFYTNIAGWLLYYFYKMMTGGFQGLNPAGVQAQFSDLLADPATMTLFMVIIIIACFGICKMGLQKGVERITKYMMICLLFLMIVLSIRSITLPNAQSGLSFYLLPDLNKIKDAGLMNVISAAMGQAFFTLSLGIGAMEIFGSCTDRKHTLTSEAIFITILDTSIALLSGLIIFPASFSFGIDPGNGPNLIFITLPNIFNAMSNGQLWGTLFFLCMIFAAVSTIIAVFQNIISFWMDLTGCSRNKAIFCNLIAITLLSLPSVLGYNVLSAFAPLGSGSTILDLEDFIVSNNILPLGSMIYVLFCTTRYGWGWKNFTAEANTGEGAKFPTWIRTYAMIVIPIIILFLFAQGYWTTFVK